MIRLVVSGCCGKMGQRIITLAAGEKELKLAGVIESKSHPAIGKKLAEVVRVSLPDIKISDDCAMIKTGDVLIEFTNPLATVEHLDFADKYKKPLVIGTTGLDAAGIRKIKQASNNIAIVFSPNMSVGVNLVFKLVKEAAQKLNRDYKVDILETHHVHKKDAPSGTARRLAELVKEVSARRNAEVAINSIREGEVVGEHQIRFDGPQDTIFIKHSAKTRDIFAQGALEAAKFVVKQRPGLYDMQDVIEAS